MAKHLERKNIYKYFEAYIFLETGYIMVVVIERISNFKKLIYVPERKDKP